MKDFLELCTSRQVFSKRLEKEYIFTQAVKYSLQI